MKRLIYFLGLIFLSIIIILNLVYTANLSSRESINISNNNFLYNTCIILTALGIFLITTIIDKYLYKENKTNSKLRKYLFWGVLIIYIIINIRWIKLIKPKIIADSLQVYNLATRPLYRKYRRNTAKSNIFRKLFI